jgi:GGDEF domain-containing protein
MNLPEITKWGKPQSAAGETFAVDNTQDCLTALVEGVAESMPRVDAARYSEFRGKAALMSAQIPKTMENSERMKAVRMILREFDSYRVGFENTLREREKSWKTLTNKLMREMLAALDISHDSAGVPLLVEGIEPLSSTEQIQNFCSQLEDFLQSRAAGQQTAQPASLTATDTSMTNDNAAGLPGGGAAIERLRKAMERGSSGFVVIFRLSCLEMVSQRFGLEAAEDCIMAVAAYLTSSLHSDDAIFHWSDSSLVAILMGRSNEPILDAELRNIVHKNSDIHVKIDDRPIMLRIPISFEILPITRFNSAEDLYKLWAQEARKR